MKRNSQREEVAKEAAQFIRKWSELESCKPDIGIILGTGWSNALLMNEGFVIPLEDVPGFSKLEKIKGHKRNLVVGDIEDQIIVALDGRVHLNEAPNNPDIAEMVRLQTEMLCQLGVKQLIITSAVGSLRGAINVGEIAVIDGFVTLFAPTMPLWAGEFCSPEDTISQQLKDIAHRERGNLITKEVGHAMVRGPFFEGRKYDKALLAASGAGVVGMSSLPEACIAALYEVETLVLGFVTNDDMETHSHEENLRKSKDAAELLEGFLGRIIKKI